MAGYVTAVLAFVRAELRGREACFFPYHKRVRFANLMPQSDLSRGRYRSTWISAQLPQLSSHRSRSLARYTKL